MTRLTLKSALFLLAVVLLSPRRGTAADYFVATDGNDSWSGRLAAPNPGKTDGPFATLERARNQIRRLKKAGQLSGGATVSVRGGRYTMPKGFQLAAEDSGTREEPIVYRAHEPEKPVLIGGRAITGFRPCKGEILEADVGAQGFRGVSFRQLLFDGQRQQLARYPNYDAGNPYGGGWAYVDGKDISMYQNVPGEDHRSLLYRARDARDWKRPEEGEVFIFPRYNWWNNIVRIASLDRDRRLLTLAADASYPIRPGDRYYVRNLFEELDAPGEWYLDRQSWKLYFWPPSPLTGRAVFAPTTRTIWEVGPGTAHITIQGFTFECSEGTALVLNNTRHCLVAANTIRNVGDYHGSGVAINGGTGNGVVGNDIAHTGSHGVVLSGGDRKTLTPAGNFADNNYIHHVGVFYKQGVGIQLGGVGNRASHNLIHDGPRMGIMFSGNNLLIEYNHIRHVNLETEDTGAVYTGGRDWISSRGTVIRHNYFHDILGYGRHKGKWVSPHFAWGVYLDDNAGGVDVIGNIVARCPRAAVHLHNGRDNHIENNILLDSRLQQVEYNGWTEKHPYWKSHLPEMIKGFELVAGEPAWRTMRHMDLHPSKAVLPDGKIMTGNRFLRNIISYRDPQAKLFRFSNLPLDHYESDHNLVYHFGKPLLTGQQRVSSDEWAAWQALGFDRHSLVADPLFVDPTKDDYRLKPGSPAFTLGFKPIPVEQIGPYRDRLRASWPIVEAEGAREKPLGTGGG